MWVPIAAFIFEINSLVKYWKTTEWLEKKISAIVLNVWNQIERLYSLENYIYYG